MSQNAALLASLGLNTEVKENEVIEGGKLEELPVGTYGARLVGVIETGEHPGFEGTKTKNETMLVFQMFGKKVPESKDKDGKDIARLEFVRLNKNFGAKGNFLPVFNTLNNGGSDLNFFQLIGSPCRIKREEYKKQNGDKGIKVPLPTGIMGTMIEVMDDDGMGTGEYKSVNVPEATADIMVYQWATGNQAQFDTLPFWIQKIISEALNFKGSKAEGLEMKPDPRKNKEDSEEEEAPAEEPKTVKKEQPNKTKADEEFEF